MMRMRAHPILQAEAAAAQAAARRLAEELARERERQEALKLAAATYRAREDIRLQACLAICRSSQ